MSNESPSIPPISPDAVTRAAPTSSSPTNGTPSARDSRGSSPRRDPKHLARLFESLPPHAIEAEMSLLGSILIEPQVLGDVIFIIKKGDDFYKPAHASIYEAMVTLYDRHSALDIVQLHQTLLDKSLLETIGGLDYLVQLANSVPSATNAVHYARLVREKSLVRQLIGAAGEILYDAHHSPEEARKILDEAEHRIFKIAMQTETASAETLHELIRETMDRIEANLGQALSGVPTGFRELDEMTTGLQAGEMLILAARPSMGKTALALNIAENMAVRGYPVGVFSLEMSKQQLVQRLLCSRSGIDSQRLRRNMLGKNDFRALMAACDELQQAPIYIDDTPGLTLLQLRAKARRLAAKHAIKAVVIDYLQLMSVGGRVESRQIEVGEISRGVKAMARELRVPVICLSQLNRAAETREGHRPRMSDLRESGSIEQDADVVMLLHREDYYHKDDPDWVAENPELLGLAELILSKQRNGPTGTVRLSWISQSTRFRDYSSAHPPGGTGGGGYGGGGYAGSAPPAIATYEPKMPAASHAGAASSMSVSASSAIDDDEAPPFSIDAPASDTGVGAAGSAFANRPKTGPVTDFRDGGGPDLEEDEYDGLPI